MVSHDVLTYLCARELGLERYTVAITPYTYNDPGPYNPLSEIEYREGKRPTVKSNDPHIDEDRFYAPFVQYNPPASNCVKAIEVLSIYSAEPDWGMDEKLELSFFQRLTGDSLGYRHMRYGLFFFRAGIAHRRAVYFTELARSAFEKGDLYWGIRFSGRAIHYIEDLLTPLHTKPFSELFFLRKIISLKIKKLPLIAFNYHHSFERFTGHHLWHGENGYLHAITLAPLAKINNLKRDLRKGWRASRRIFYPHFREWRRIIPKRAERESVLLSPDDVASIKPPANLKKCIER
ncbi:MAG: hypothetical protein JSV25_09020, partial [Spirochaetota bacterium]